MKERPILFSGPMVQAILDSRKTQTRRPVKFKNFDRSDTPGYDWHFRGTLRGSPKSSLWQDLHHTQLLDLCPFGQVGDRLWVRETAWYDDCFGGRAFFENGDVIQKGEGIISQAPHPCSREMFAACGLQKCRPSIHMPRWASRITLAITAVRVERLQAINEEGACEEGIQLPASTDYRPLVRISGKYPPCDYAEPRRPGESLDDAILRHWTHRTHFASLWDSINAKRPGYVWADNPWVWVIEFLKVPTQTKGE